MSELHDTFPSYHAGPSTGHEVGVMFGFLGFCIVFVGVYWVTWQVAQRRSYKKEAARREALSARGINEKGVDQHGNQVHGMREDLGYNHNRTQSQDHDGLGIGRGSPSFQQYNSPQFRNGGEEIWRE